MIIADLLAAVAPVVLLVYLMARRNGLPSQVALPIAAGALYLLKLIYFREDANLVNATVLSGLLYAWTPIMIVWGAVFMFNTLENSGGMATIRRWLNGITANRTAQLMIVGWSFSFFIEGASGFGTPAAIAAPVLVGLGFEPVRVALLCLIMNSVPIAFGAVGTPLWFGIGQLGLSAAELKAVGFKSALIHSAAALVIPPLALGFVLPWREIRRNLLFVYLCILGTNVPFVMLARYDCEFPSLAGGAVGLAVAVFLARRGVGLAAESQRALGEMPVRLRELTRVALPIWGAVLILLVTRVPYFGLKGLLNAAEPAARLSLGTLGELNISPGLVVSLRRVFGSNVEWTHKLLYVPSIIPFFVISLVTFLVLRMDGAALRRTWNATIGRLAKPILALSGALVFVRLLMVGEERSCAMIIGRSLAAASGAAWPAVAAFLGAVGAFIGGSNTVANLTFAAIQDSVAANLGLNRTTILALQHVGGAMGLMLSISHVIAVLSVLGVAGREGFIIRRAFPPMLIYGIIAGAVGLLL